MGLIHVTVSLRVPGGSNGIYEGIFLVDTGATDSMAPSSELSRMFASWNQLDGWLRQVDVLRRAA